MQVIKARPALSCHHPQRLWVQRPERCVEGSVQVGSEQEAVPNVIRPPVLDVDNMGSVEDSCLRCCGQFGAEDSPRALPRLARGLIV